MIKMPGPTKKRLSGKGFPLMELLDQAYQQLLKVSESF